VVLLGGWSWYAEKINPSVFARPPVAPLSGRGPLAVSPPGERPAVRREASAPGPRGVAESASGTGRAVSAVICCTSVEERRKCFRGRCREPGVRPRVAAARTPALGGCSPGPGRGEQHRRRSRPRLAAVRRRGFTGMRPSLDPLLPFSGAFKDVGIAEASGLQSVRGSDARAVSSGAGRWDRLGDEAGGAESSKRAVQSGVVAACGKRAADRVAGGPAGAAGAPGGLLPDLAVGDASRLTRRSRLTAGPWAQSTFLVAPE
jgi:hypothetical protein